MIHQMTALPRNTATMARSRMAGKRISSAAKMPMQMAVTINSYIDGCAFPGQLAHDHSSNRMTTEGATRPAARPAARLTAPGARQTLSADRILSPRHGDGAKLSAFDGD